MTVRELIEALLDYELEKEVFLAADAEGNAVVPLADLADGVDEDEDYGTGEPVVVLWPV